MTERGRRHDISVLVRPGTPEWPGDTPYDCRWTWEMAAGASVQVSAITMSPHVGTHADAPLHVRSGAAGSETLPLDAFMGAALLVSVGGEPRGPGHRRSCWPVCRLARSACCCGPATALPTAPFPDAWPSLTPEAARALTTRGLRLLGLDCPSADRRDSTTLDVHHALFAGGAQLLENLDLRHVPDGEYELLALPMLLDGLDAAPVRAVLFDRVGG